MIMMMMMSIHVKQQITAINIICWSPTVKQTHIDIQKQTHRGKTVR